MPNWCRNRTTILGPVADVARFVERARGERQHYAPSRHDNPTPEVSALSFHALVPIPDSIMAGPYDPAGYHAEAALWGVKWGACRAQLVLHDAGVAVYEYETPWGPAHKLWERVAREWPALVVLNSWSEEYPTSGRDVYARGEHHDFERLIAGPYEVEYVESESDEQHDARCAAAETAWRRAHDRWAGKVAALVRRRTSS